VRSSTRTPKKAGIHSRNQVNASLQPMNDATEAIKKHIKSNRCNFISSRL
jgi:glycine cleavage system regulatory protein